MAKATAKKKAIRRKVKVYPYIKGLHINEYRRLQRKKEPLLRELLPYVTESYQEGCWGLNHPLLIELVIDPAYCAVVNRVFELRQQWLAEAKESRNWVRYFDVIEPAYRLKKLKEVLNELTDSDYWERLGQMYILTEIVSFQQKTVRDLFSSSRPEREKLMDAEERKILDDLPDEVTIYRGYDLNNSKGWSWTLSEEKAEWFANRWRKAYPERKRRVATGKVRKKDIIAYFDGRNEKEIVVNPQKVKAITRRTLD